MDLQWSYFVLILQSHKMTLSDVDIYNIIYVEQKNTMISLWVLGHPNVKDSFCLSISYRKSKVWSWRGGPGRDRKEAVVM